MAGPAGPCFMSKPHWHSQVEVNFIFSGSVTYEMPTHSLTLASGDLCIFWGGQPHQAVHSEPETEFVAIHLPLMYFFRLALPSDVKRTVMRGASLVTRYAGQSDFELFIRIGEFMRSDDEKRKEHATEELLLRIGRMRFEPFNTVGANASYVEQAGVLDGTSYRNVTEICDYITENFKHDIDASDIAASVNKHPKYAMTVFKKATGMTLNEYLTLLRISYAQSLLVQDKLTILDVAMESGFGSLSTFSQTFRKMTGHSPAAYRRSASWEVSTA